MKATKTLEAVDKYIEDNQENGNRWHLGASLIGRECAREIWYKYRWVKVIRHAAQLLRLFDRGHREEERFVGWLRDAGYIVWDVDPDTGKQFRISHEDGHFGGSLDAVIEGLEDVPNGEPALGEFKTHGEKSFKGLQKEGVKASKMEHIVQMNLYMDYYDLNYALYFPISKNTDALLPEIIERDDRIAKQYIERAKMIIRTNEPPPRVSESPGWWKCKICDYHGICHTGEPATMNCRTCKNSARGPDRTWICTLHGEVFEKPKGNQISMMELGCSDHEFLPGLEV